MARELDDAVSTSAPECGVEEQSFAEMYERYYPRVLKLVQRFLNGGGDPEGIAQEAFLRAWASYGRFRTGESFWAWLSAIARRLCIEYFRRRESDARRLTTKVTMSYNPVPDPVDLVIGLEEQQSMREAMRELPTRDQRLLALRAVEGWSYAEISEHEGISVEAVRSALKRARVALRRAYDGARGGLVAVVLRGRHRVREAARSLQGDVATLFGMMTRLGELAGMAGMAAMAATVAVAGSSPSPTGTGTTVLATALSPVAAVGTTTSPASPSSIEERSVPERAAEPVRSASPVMPAIPARAPLATSHAGSPSEAIMQQMTISPDGSIVFASGSCTGRLYCTAMFRSRDFGATWEPIPGAPNGPILLPPAYPADPRIFFTGDYTLQMSPDDGRTFGVVAAIAAGAGAAIAGTGPGGAVRVIYSSLFTGQWDYDEELGTVRPVTLPGVMVGDRIKMLRGTSPDDETAWFSRNASGRREVVSCQRAVCTAAPVAEPYDMQIAVGPDGVWTWGDNLHRSIDDGLSFQPVAPPVAGSLAKVVVAADGVYVSVAYSSSARGGLFRTRDSGRTWQRLGDHDDFYEGVGAFVVLGGGRIIAAPGSVHERGLLCSSDDGGTWSRCNG